MDKKQYINPFSQKSEELSKQFDILYDLGDKNKIFDLIDKAKALLVDEENVSKAKINYSIGTAYGNLISMVSDEERGKIQNHQIYYLRESISYLELGEVNLPEYVPYIAGLKMNLYTNYGNALDHIGRKIASIEQYKRALSINPDFGMALGNLGLAYHHYGVLVYDPVHRDYFHYFSYHYLKKAVNSNDPSLYESARNSFSRILTNYHPDYVENVLKKPLNISDYSYDNKEEYEYRKWVLDKGLFLNPLNDLYVGEFCFSGDILQLPNMVMKVGDKPVFHGMFNQFKQEYIFARYQYYSSLEAPDEPHYADKETYLLNFSDYPQYSIRIEMLKNSFKVLYSLLDKIAYFINFYFDLGIKERDVSFHNIWLKEKKGSKGYKYKNVLNPHKNFALSSIYWISKDFYKKLGNSPNPQAKRISEIRNALEHKYVKICWDFFDYKLEGEIDDLALYIKESEFFKETYILLRLIREVLICLSLAVSIEENKKDKDSEKLPKINFMEYDDEWKV